MINDGVGSHDVEMKKADWNSTEEEIKETISEEGLMEHDLGYGSSMIIRSHKQQSSYKKMRICHIGKIRNVSKVDIVYYIMKL